MKSDDSGFTVIELLISILVLALLAGVMGGIFSVSLRTTTETQQRLDGSHDAQIIGAYFVKDVQSADTVLFSTSGCGSGSGSAVVRLVWDDLGTTKQATWAYRASDKRLVRTFCQAGESDKVLVLGNALGAQPTLACGTTPCTATARLVTLQVKSADGYQFKLTGSRRAA